MTSTMTGAASPGPVAPAGPGDLAGLSCKALGTYCSVLVTEPAKIERAFGLLTAELTAIDLACSRFRPDAELVAINRAAGTMVRISPLLADAIAVALRVAEATDGDVDPTCGLSLIRLGYDRDFGQLARRHGAAPVPAPAAGWRLVHLDRDALTVRLPVGSVLDLGATAKALAADRAATAIAADLGCGVLVNLGGDISVAGKPPAEGWRIEIAAEQPRRPDGSQPPGWRPAGWQTGQVVAIHSGGLATSSWTSRCWWYGGNRLHHIVQPRTGRPAARYWSSVSAAAATCVDANAATTAAVIRAEAAVSWLAGLGIAARLVQADGTVITTGGWPK